jgi:hypothetical protein
MLVIAMTAALLAALVWALLPVILFLSWSSHGDEMERATLATEHRWAQEALDRLRRPASDGVLTDDELEKANISAMAVLRTDSQIRITSAYSASFGLHSMCYVLIVNKPPLSRTTPASLETTACLRWSPPTPTRVSTARSSRPR